MEPSAFAVVAILRPAYFYIYSTCPFTLNHLFPIVNLSVDIKLCGFACIEGHIHHFLEFIYPFPERSKNIVKQLKHKIYTLKTLLLG